MRVCGRTGLALVDGPVVGYRIAKTSRGPLAPPVRSDEPDEDRSLWSRFDTPGRTVYLAEHRRTAFAETLSMARIREEFRSAVDFVAAQFGVTRTAAHDLVEQDWERNGNMTPESVPAVWRDDRRVYRISAEATALWVDLTEMDSLTTIDRGLRVELLGKYGVDLLTLGDLTGEDHAVTCLIADWVRTQIVETGVNPAGVRFHSKFGAGICWAYWLQRSDVDVGDDSLRIVEQQEIKVDDPDLREVAALYGAKCH